MKKLFLTLSILFPLISSAQWNKIYTSVNTDLFDVQLLGSRAYIVGYGSTLLRSVDTGKSWTKLSLTTPNHLRAVHFVNHDTGFVIGENARIQKTVNGGNTWTQKYVRTAAYGYDVAFQGLHGIAVGKDMLAVSSNDLGENWGVDTTFLSSKKLNSVCITPSGMCWAVGDSGYLISKHVSQRKWKDLKFQTKIHLNHISNIGDSFLIICGGMADSTVPSQFRNIMYISYDSGKNWIEENIDELRVINTAWFADTDTGFMAGSNGLISKVYHPLTNRGKQIPGTASSINSISFHKSIGLFVGDGGTIYRTKNRGGFALSIQTIQKTKTVLYPNPCEGSLYIADDRPIEQIKVFDHLGRVVEFDYIKENSSLQFDAQETQLLNVMVYFTDGTISHSTVLIQEHKK